jgi:hypothetical protein
MLRAMYDGAHQLGDQLLPAEYEWLEQIAVGRTIHAEPSHRLRQRAPKEHRCSIVERVRECDERFDQVEVETERTKERRCSCSRMDRRTEVVAEARERQLCGARSTTDRLLRFDDADRASGLRERDRGREAVRARADDDGV